MVAIDPLGGRRTGVSGRSARIKEWVRREFGLSGDMPVTVMELRCSEEGCPPVETVIGILDWSEGARRYKVHKRMAEVGYEDVARLASGRQDPSGAASEVGEA